MLDYIYHSTLKVLLNRVLVCKAHYIVKYDPFKKMLHSLVTIFVLNNVLFSTLIVTITSAVNLRIQNQANASLISIRVVILYQIDRVV